MVYDKIYQQYVPLFAIELKKETKKLNFESKVINCIKAQLRDPSSLQIDEGDYVKYSWDLYVKCDSNGVTAGASSGRYSQQIYFWVDFRAKNGFGGYNQSGAWLSYNGASVTWATTSKSAYTTYGTNKDLDRIGYVSISK